MAHWLYGVTSTTSYVHFTHTNLLQLPAATRFSFPCLSWKLFKYCYCSL